MNGLSVPSIVSTINIYPAASEKLLNSVLDSITSKKKKSLEERVTLLLIRDLVRIGWRLRSNLNNVFELTPPAEYTKEVAKEAMSYSRDEIIRRDTSWIEKHLSIGRANLAYGNDVLNSDILPRIEVCKTQEQNNIFRIFRYYWSSPVSDYVGRRIRLLVRDDGIKGSPVIGIAALGSSIIHIHDRDKWIGWDIKTRSDRIIYMMDAYVLGAMPPYNYLLGGKLISYILASNEMRKIYKKKYLKQRTIIKKRKASDLVMLMTTSLYGQNSSQYNRLKYGKSLLYKPIGETSGYGSLHISDETFEVMNDLAYQNDYNTSNKFGEGPNWRMRVIRAACDVLNLDSNTILKHSFQRGLFAIPLAVNWKSYLNGTSTTPIYRNLPMKKLVNYWKNRWLQMRKQNESVIQNVISFTPSQFKI